MIDANLDPIHLNDIEPVFHNSKHWKKEIFLSLRHKSAIIHFRPSTSEVINYITGPFSQQHDIDIISSNEISIFNNNNYFEYENHSEILIYNFETKNFKKFLMINLKKNFKTYTEGLSHFFKMEHFLLKNKIMENYDL